MNSEFAKPPLAPKPKTLDHSSLTVIKYPSSLMSRSSLLPNLNSISRGPKPPIAPKPVVLPAPDRRSSLCINNNVNRCTNGEMTGSDEEIYEGIHCSIDCPASNAMEITNDEYIVVSDLRNEERDDFRYENDQCFPLTAERQTSESSERDESQEEEEDIASNENSHISAAVETVDSGSSNLVEAVNYDAEESTDIENADNKEEIYDSASPAAEMVDLVSKIVDEVIDSEINSDATEDGFIFRMKEMFHDVNLAKENEYNLENVSALDIDEDVSSSICDNVIFTDLCLGVPSSVCAESTNPENKLHWTCEEEEKLVNTVTNVCCTNDADFELNTEFELDIDTVEESTSSKEPYDDEGTDVGLEMGEDEQHGAEFSEDSCSDAEVENEREASLISPGAIDSKNGKNTYHEDNVDDGYQTIEIKSEEEASETAHDEMEDLKEEDMNNYDIDDSCQIIPFENDCHEDVTDCVQGNLDDFLLLEDCGSYGCEESAISQSNIEQELESDPGMGPTNSNIIECILEENHEDVEVEPDEPLHYDGTDTSKDGEVDIISNDDSANFPPEEVIMEEEGHVTEPLAENIQGEITNDDKCKDECSKYVSSSAVSDMSVETDEDESNPYVLGDSLPLKCNSTLHGEETVYSRPTDGPPCNWIMKELSMDAENSLFSLDRKNIVTRSRSHSGKLPGCVPETVPEEPGPETDSQSSISDSVSNIVTNNLHPMDGNRVLPAKPRRFILYPRSYSVEGRDIPVSVCRDSDESTFVDSRIKRRDDNLSLPCVMSSSSSFSLRNHCLQGGVSTPSSVVDIPPPFELACITKKPITKSSPSLLIENESPDKYFKKKKLSFKRFLTLKFKKKTENKIHVDVNVSSSRSSSESSYHGPARVVELDRRSLGSSPQLKSRSGKLRASESPSMVLFYKDGKRKGMPKTYSRSVARVESFEDRARPPFMPLPLTKPRSISFPNADTSDYENIPAMSSDYENIQIPSRRPIRTGTFTEFFEDPSRALSSANDNDGYVDMSSFNTLEIKQQRADQETDSAYTEPYKVCPIALLPLEDVTSDEEQKSSEDEEASPGESCLAHKKEGQSRVHLIAEELLSSEKEYVEMLRRLQMGFYGAVLQVLDEEDEGVSEEGNLRQGFSELPEIFQLHQEILAELEERILDWQENQKIAGVFLSRESRFRHHVAYVTQFDKNLALLDESCPKSPQLAAVLRDFENQDCSHISVKHQLLKVTERIFQYHMILTDYLNNLRPDSAEYEDTQAALAIVSETSDQANDSMRQGENLQKLVHIQHSVRGQSSLLQPGREFVKEGTLMKVCEKSRHPRHLFLMNDVLLYTYPQKDGKYRLKNTLSVAGMRVSRPIGEKVQNLLKVECLDSSLTLSASSCSERDEWYSTINRTVLEYYQSHNALGYHHSMEVKEKLGTSLGEKPPTLIPVSHVMMCMSCGCDFKLTLRRHHCHACGKIICRNCSRHRYPLKYLKDRIAKVCDNCYTELRKRDLPALSVSYPPPSNRFSGSAFSSVFHNIHPTAFKKQKKIPSALMEAASSGRRGSQSAAISTGAKGGKNTGRNSGLSSEAKSCTHTEPARIR
ncbi:FYVE, RhoGEF and PH domain-containing protein 5 isoform X1 [Rhinatrema bivittatum]|uniref:FYVE, RhoGEF and PH domain-containing protein 5 isoform X1 n=2 Tax=Rhinatrema bivittatum TaxID=194408 RepID=UPI0011270605|nr:FYVE, RhoGEF and PH domain-containing protein 5 isoform X1 [Rhinatrema bivittatum]